jgi:hypothetical protein
MLKTIKNLFDKEKIKKIHLEQYKKEERIIENQITKNECIAHQFLYTNKNSTKEKVSKDINYKTKKNHSRQSFDKQLKKFNINFYDHLHNDIIKQYTSYTNSNNLNKINNNNIKSLDIDLDEKIYDEYVSILVDESCSNSYSNNKLITTNTLYFYNLNDNINIDNFVCKKTKNNKNKK